MATQVQLRGGTTSEHSSFTGAAREVTVDTDKDVVVVHDGSTAGGIPLAKEASVLPLAGGTMTGNITLGTNTIDGLEINTTATSNLGLGTGAVDSITTGDYNVGIGDSALTATTSGIDNVAVGRNALSGNTTGLHNTAIGDRAMTANVDGGYNTAVGLLALGNNISGSYNVATGRSALQANLGSFNTASGYIALSSNTTGTSNTATGYQALGSNTTGSNNTATGYQALAANTTGANNTALGYLAGDNITTGSSNIIIGAGVDAPSATASNQLNIGNTIYGDTSTGNVGIGTSSPSARLEIKDGGNTYGTSLRLSQSYNSAYSYIASNQGGSMSFDAGVGASSPTFHFKTNNTERMRIDSNGTVLVGKTTSAFSDAGTALYQNGELNLVHANNAPLYLRRLSGTGTLAQFWQGSSVVGSIGVTGSSTSYNTSSDYRLKENVVPMTGSIDRLKALKPSSFNFISEPLKIVDGFLAHEAGEVVPECATGTKDAMMDEEYEVTPAVMDGETVVTEAVMGTRSVPDYQGIDQSKLVPLLVASLQEAIARIEVLENA